MAEGSKRTESPVVPTWSGGDVKMEDYSDTMIQVYNVTSDCSDYDTMSCSIWIVGHWRNGRHLLTSSYWQLINATITSISITYNDGKIQHSFYFATIIQQEIQIIGTFVNGNIIENREAF